MEYWNIAIINWNIAVIIDHDDDDDDDLGLVHVALNLYPPQTKTNGLGNSPFLGRYLNCYYHHHCHLRIFNNINCLRLD